MSLKEIIKAAEDKVEEMGGGEQYIGKTHELAAQCNAAKNDDTVFDWLVDLGDGLEKKGLQLVVGPPGRSQDLYAKPKAE